jgi:nicotinamide mononucleotide transporter
MAKGWTEFWLIWIAVDVVGVPLLFSSGYYATGTMYVIYGLFTATGFVVWWRAQRRPVDAILTAQTGLIPVQRAEPRDGPAPR